MPDYRMGPRPGPDRSSEHYRVSKSKDIGISIMDWCWDSGKVEDLRRVMIGNPRWVCGSIAICLCVGDVLKVCFQGIELKIVSKDVGAGYNEAIVSLAMDALRKAISPLYRKRQEESVVAESVVAESVVAESTSKVRESVVGESAVTVDAVSRLTNAWN